jgi:hypothetical protein
MRINVKLLGLTVLAVELELPALEVEDEEEVDGDVRLTTSDHTIAFGFNPLNIDEYWEDEDHANIQENA